MARTAALESIVEATRSYEAWVARQVPLVAADVRFKHEQMALAPLAFLRATFYRWVQQWNACCADLARASDVLAVGDLHTENFGTWRDSEGRLIWGINDFDEAFPLAYTIDLVRLATSARLAIAASTLQLSARAACAAILDGYRAGLRGGGRLPYRRRGEGVGRVRRELGSEPPCRPKVHYRAIVDAAVRSADPFLEVRARWVLRLLAPDCSRIEFTAARTPADQTDLLEAMGAETANVHIGSGKRRIAAVRADLGKRDPRCLRDASKVMERLTLADHAAWQASPTFLTLRP